MSRRVRCSDLDIIYQGITSFAGLGDVSIDMDRATGFVDSLTMVNLHVMSRDTKIYVVSSNKLSEMCKVRLSASRACGVQPVVIVNWTAVNGTACVAIVHRVSIAVALMRDSQPTPAYCITRDQFMSAIWCMQMRMYLSDYLIATGIYLPCSDFIAPMSLRIKPWNYSRGERRQRKRSHVAKLHEDQSSGGIVLVDVGADVDLDVDVDVDVDVVTTDECSECELLSYDNHDRTITEISLGDSLLDLLSMGQLGIDDGTDFFDMHNQLSFDSQIVWFSPPLRPIDEQFENNGALSVIPTMVI